MSIYSVLTIVCWVVFYAVWLIAAFGAKKNLRWNFWWRTLYIRIALIVVVVLFLRFSTNTVTFQYFGDYGLIYTSPFIRAVGVALCAAGIAFAIWARVYLGRNWGMPMSLKVNPELVTTGPYAYVRHPIYAGMFLALFGSLIADGIFWLIPLAACFFYFLYSAQVEEKIMLKEFPNEYPQYRKGTKKIVPFVW
jgi:protein-S-isoprenylcysteine O-methyltransferase Ste14